MNNKLILKIFLILAIAYMLVVRILLIFSYSIDLDGTEFVFVRHILLLMDHKNIYTNPAEFPYPSCLFVPGYLYFLKTIVCLFDKSLREDLHFICMLGRSISYVAFIIQISLLVGYWRKRFQVSWYAVLILLCLYLMMVSGHIFVVRPDALKFLFFMISFFALIEYEFFNQKVVYLIVSLLFAVLDVYFKQDMLIYQSILIGVLFIFTKKPKYIMLLLAFWLTIVGIYGLLLLVFGRYYFDNTVLLNFQKVNNAGSSINMVFVLLSAARIIPLLFMLEYFRRKRTKQFQDSLAVRYMIWVATALFVVSHLFILRAGSYVNYAFETIFVVLFAIGASMSTILSDSKSLRQIRFIVLPYMMFLFLTTLLAHGYTYSLARERDCKKIYFQKIEYANQLKAIVQNDVTFLPNIENVLYNRNLNLIYGYDYHIGRFVSLIIPKAMGTVDTKLTFYDSKKYDDCFENGTVKYIVNETERDYYIKKYHPQFLPYKTVGNLTVYKYPI